jgi:hypothetical protein
VICHWGFVIGHLSLVIGHWSLVISHWFFGAEDNKRKSSKKWYTKGDTRCQDGKVGITGMAVIGHKSLVISNNQF